MRMYFLCYNVHCRWSSLRVYRTECFFDVVEGHTSQYTFSLICGGHYSNYYLHKIFTTVYFLLFYSLGASMARQYPIATNL